MTTEPNQTIDPMDAAMETEYSATKVYFGQMTVDTFFCVLEKGVGKSPFDPAVHSADSRRVSIDLALLPLPGSRADFNVERSLIAESKEWANTIKPSLKAISLDLKSVHNRWVKVEMVKIGEYTSKQDGEKKDKTTFKFIEVYPTVEACQEASDKFFRSRREEGNQSALGLTDTDTEPNNPEKETAAKFLPALFKQSGGDLATFANLIANNSLTSKYFNIGSKEVVALIQPAAA